MSIDLSNAYIKLGRARDHIAELEQRIASYLASDFYRISTNVDETSGTISVDFESLHEPDQALRAVIGDAVGNLRSTLDYAAVALVSPITKQSDKIGFPFADDPNGFKGEVTKAAFSVCSQAIQDHLLNEVQAYKGGKGNTFWTVNKLRNIDKHRLLVATAEMARLTISMDTNIGLTIRDMTVIIPAGEKRGIIQAPVAGAKIELTKEPTPGFEIRINEAGVLERLSAVTFLTDAAKDTQSLLDALSVL